MTVRSFTRKATVVLAILLAGCLALAAPQAQEQPVAEPSLGALARKVRAERAEAHLKDVPLFTNDNLPRGPAGLGVIGTSGPAAGEETAPLLASQQAEKQKMEELRYGLSQAQQRLQMHQRELSVLQKELGQSNMQYYPNPNQTLLQEYNREDIDKLTGKIYSKRQQIADDQEAVSNLQDKFKSAQSRWGWFITGPGSSAAPAAPPITAKPGTPAYWQARLQAAREELATAKEKEKLAEDELRLLGIQQASTINPDLQAGLGSAISAKQDEVTAAQQALQHAQKQLEDVHAAIEAGSGRPDGNPQDSPHTAHMH